MVAPCDIGQRANCHAEAPIAWHLPGKQVLGPRAERFGEIGDARIAEADRKRALDQRVAILLLLAQLRVEPPFPQAKRGKDHTVGLQFPQHAPHHQCRGRQGINPPAGDIGKRGHLLWRHAGDGFDQVEDLLGRQVVAVNHADRPVVHRLVNPGERPPSAAHGIQDRLGQHRRQARPEDLVDLLLGLFQALSEHGAHGKRPERHADLAIAHVVAEHLGDFEAAAADIPDKAARLEEAGDDAERGIGCLFFARQEPRLKTGPFLDLC